MNIKFGYQKINEYELRFDKKDNEIQLVVSRYLSLDEMDLLKNILIHDKIIEQFVEFINENKNCSKCSGEMHHCVNGSLMNNKFNKYYNKFNKICYDCDEINF